MVLMVPSAPRRRVSFPAAAPPAIPSDAATASVVKATRFFLDLRDQSSRLTTALGFTLAGLPSDAPGHPISAATSADGGGTSVTRNSLSRSNICRNPASAATSDSASSSST
ncbi:hypothetical protein SAMN06272721_12610 [Arthrobacter sp. P2b]|nr:hypothetical protein SAMN06272721_12610 [Arthrobacter sp. P2b]